MSKEDTTTGKRGGPGGLAIVGSERLWRVGGEPKGKTVHVVHDKFMPKVRENLKTQKPLKPTSN